MPATQRSAKARAALVSHSILFSLDAQQCLQHRRPLGNVERVFLVAWFAVAGRVETQDLERDCPHAHWMG